MGKFFLFGALIFLQLGMKIPPPPQYYVLDQAHLLSASQINQLDRQLDEFESSTNHQFRVAIFASLENEDFEDYVNRTFREWKIGKSGKNDGVLLAISVADRRYKTEVGYGLEGILTDAYTSRVSRNILVPHFRQEKYFEGLSQVIASYKDALIKGKEPEEKTVLPKGSLVVVVIVFILLFVFLQILAFVARHTNVTSTTSKRRRDHNDYSGGGGGWWWGGGGGGWGGGSGWGGGGGFSGGGFGGGGSSGGGGASGRW